MFQCPHPGEFCGVTKHFVCQSRGWKCPLSPCDSARGHGTAGPLLQTGLWLNVAALSGMRLPCPCWSLFPSCCEQTFGRGRQIVLFTRSQLTLGAVGWSFLLSLWPGMPVLTNTSKSFHECAFSPLILPIFASGRSQALHPLMTSSSFHLCSEGRAPTSNKKETTRIFFKKISFFLSVYFPPFPIRGFP